jgi:hypothetical protein
MPARIGMSGGHMRKNLFAAAVLVLLVVMAGLVYGQGQDELSVTIPQSWSIGGKVLPAGKYHFVVASATRNLMQVHSEDGKNTASVTVVSRLAASVKEGTPRLVFDNFNDQYILAEVWLPNEDGFLISGFKNDAEHKHTQIKGGFVKP